MSVYREGMEFNHPLIVRKATARRGPLPKRWGWLEISHPNVVLTALKPGRDRTTVLRLYEAAGQAATGVRVSVRAKILSAHEANLLEDPVGPLTTHGNTLQFDLHPFEIKTIAVKL